MHLVPATVTSFASAIPLIILSQYLPAIATVYRIVQDLEDDLYTSPGSDDIMHLLSRDHLHSGQHFIITITHIPLLTNSIVTSEIHQKEFQGDLQSLINT